LTERPLSADRRQVLQTYLRMQARLIRSHRREPGAHGDDTGRTAAHPLEFDERGFPVAQPNGGGLSERIQRLLAIAPQYDSFDHRTEKP
jgi:hypothetical protein